jgi:hypothetical protein
VLLRRDKRRLEMENEILRRAAACFAKDALPKWFPLVRELAGRAADVLITIGIDAADAAQLVGLRVNLS